MPKSGNGLVGNKLSGRDRQRKLRWLGKSRNKNRPRKRRKIEGDNGRRYKWRRNVLGKRHEELASNRSRQPQSGSACKRKKRPREGPEKQQGEISSSGIRWPRRVSRPSASRRSRILSVRVGLRCVKRPRRGFYRVHDLTIMYQKCPYVPTRDSDGRGRAVGGVARFAGRAAQSGHFDARLAMLRIALVVRINIIDLDRNSANPVAFCA